MKFYKWHPDHNSSGLIPPVSNEPVWKKPETEKSIGVWQEPEPAKPAGPSLEEKKAAALEEAISYLQGADAHENKNLACVLMLRHGISRLDAESIVRKALELIAEGKIQNPAQQEAIMGKGDVLAGDQVAPVEKSVQKVEGCGKPLRDVRYTVILCDSGTVVSLPENTWQDSELLCGSLTGLLELGKSSPAICWNCAHEKGFVNDTEEK